MKKRVMRRTMERGFGNYGVWGRIKAEYPMMIAYDRMMPFFGQFTI